MLSFFAFCAATSEASKKWTSLKNPPLPGSPVKVNLKNSLTYQIMQQIAQHGLQQSNKAYKNKNYNLKINYASSQPFGTINVVRLTVTINYNNCKKPCQKDKKCNLIVNVGVGQNNNQPKLKEIKCIRLNLK